VVFEHVYCLQTTTNGRRVQQLACTTYIVTASTSRDWQALQAAVGSSSLPPLLTAAITRFGRGMISYSECHVACALPAKQQLLAGGHLLIT
jgi:hypothetical protein